MKIREIMTKLQLYELVSKVKKELDITEQDYPINIFNLCSYYSNVVIKEVDFHTKDLRGLVHIAENKNENHVILVNKNKTFEEKNYHGTHEFMHIITIDNSPGTTLRCFDKIRPNQNAYIEWLANEGAAELMMPYREILPLVKEASEHFCLSALPIHQLTEQLSYTYSVSTMVAHNRLNNLAYEIWQYLNGVEINDIEILSYNEQKKRNIQIDSLPDIENKMIRSVLSSRFSETQRPFFHYSSSYKFAI